jgi:hypothetical protein
MAASQGGAAAAPTLVHVRGMIDSGTTITAVVPRILA